MNDFKEFVFGVYKISMSFFMWIPLRFLRHFFLRCCGMKIGNKNFISRIVSPATSPVYREILDSYKESSFLRKDGSMDLTTVVERVSGIFRRHGLSGRNEIQEVAGVTVYPAEYFCPKDFETGELHITDKTCSIHWFDGSWVNEYDRQLRNQIHRIYKKYGENGLAKFLVILSGIKKRLEYFGIRTTVQHYR